MPSETNAASGRRFGSPSVRIFRDHFQKVVSRIWGGGGGGGKFRPHLKIEVNHRRSRFRHKVLQIVQNFEIINYENLIFECNNSPIYCPKYRIQLIEF